MEVGKETSRRVSADRRQGSQQRGHTAKRLPLLRGTYRFYIEARYQIFKLQSASSSFLQHSSWHNARPEPFPTATADSRPAHTMTPPPIRIVRLAHMRYRFADIETQHTFLADFGIRFLEEKGGKRYYAGEGPDPYVFVAEAVGYTCSLDLCLSQTTYLLPCSTHFSTNIGRQKRVPRWHFPCRNSGGSRARVSAHSRCFSCPPRGRSCRRFHSHFQRSGWVALQFGLGTGRKASSRRRQPTCGQLSSCQTPFGRI